MPVETTPLAPAEELPVTDPNAPAATGAEGAAPEGGEAPAEDPNAKAIEDARKRQAGAEKARQEAIRERDELKARLEALEASKPKPKPAEGDDAEARIAAIEAAAEERVKKAEAKAVADILNSKFPAARAKFPEITDTAKLAELEVMFGETSELPTPVGNSPAKPAAPKRYEDMSLAELRAEEKKLTRADLGLPDF